MSAFEMIPFGMRSDVFRKILEITDISALSKEEREKYDESIKIIRDYNATIEGAKILGYREGFKEKYKEGFKEGVSKSKTYTARMMLGDGEPLAKIMRYTGLTEAEIKALC